MASRFLLPTFAINMQKIKYLFDLNGYVVIRGVLNETEIASANEALSKRSHLFKERIESSLRNTVQGNFALDFKNLLLL